MTPKERLEHRKLVAELQFCDEQCKKLAKLAALWEETHASLLKATHGDGYQIDRQLPEKLGYTISYWNAARDLRRILAN